MFGSLVPGGRNLCLVRVIEGNKPLINTTWMNLKNINVNKTSLTQRLENLQKLLYEVLEQTEFMIEKHLANGFLRG